VGLKAIWYEMPQKTLLLKTDMYDFQEE